MPKLHAGLAKVSILVEGKWVELGVFDKVSYSMDPSHAEPAFILTGRKKFFVAGKARSCNRHKDCNAADEGCFKVTGRTATHCPGPHCGPVCPPCPECKVSGGRHDIGGCSRNPASKESK